MDFFEAAAIAKAQPGSTLTRDESGAFVVKLRGGSRITSRADLETIEPRSPPANAHAAELLAEVVAEARDLRLLLTLARSDIDRLNRELKALKANVARIPSSEWARFEQEQARIEDESRIVNKEQIMAAARGGRLGFAQLSLVMDNAGGLGLSPEDFAFVASEVKRLRPSAPRADGFVVHATTDGQ